MSTLSSAGSPSPSAPLPISSVAIVGVGLIGGSFGLALREAGFKGPILGVSSPPALAAALRIGAISEAGSLEDAVGQADLIYLAQPVARILDTLRALGSSVSARLARHPLLITDAGSTKHAIVEHVARLLPTNVFLAGHPMAGKEVSGVEAAEAGLFRGRPYVLSPTAGFVNPFLASFMDFILRIGAVPLELSSQDHDAIVAMTSHLPQLLSTTLALTLAAYPNPQFAVVHGAGLTDMTRLALSSPDLWESIIHTNRENVLEAVDRFAAQLAEIREAVASGNIGTFFETARTFRAQLRLANH